MKKNEACCSGFVEWGKKKKKKEEKKMQTKIRALTFPGGNFLFYEIL